MLVVVADRIMSLRSSDYSSPKKKGYCPIQHRIHEIPDHICNCPIRAVHLSQLAGHVVTGSTHHRCKPQPTGAQERPRTVSESPRPKESQSPDLAVKSVSTDNPKEGVHPSSTWKPPPHLGRSEATPEMWKPSKPTPLTADKVSPLRWTATHRPTHRNPRNPYEP